MPAILSTPVISSPNTVWATQDDVSVCKSACGNTFAFMRETGEKYVRDAFIVRNVCDFHVNTLTPTHDIIKELCEMFDAIRKNIDTPAYHEIMKYFNDQYNVFCTDSE